MKWIPSLKANEKEIENHKMGEWTKNPAIDVYINTTISIAWNRFFGDTDLL